jgi:hypothetical protein
VKRLSTVGNSRIPLVVTALAVVASLLLLPALVGLLGYRRPREGTRVWLLIQPVGPGDWARDHPVYVKWLGRQSRLPALFLYEKRNDPSTRWQDIPLLTQDGRIGGTQLMVSDHHGERIAAKSYSWLPQLWSERDNWTEVRDVYYVGPNDYMKDYTPPPPTLADFDKRAKALKTIVLPSTP